MIYVKSNLINSEIVLFDLQVSYQLYDFVKRLIEFGVNSKDLTMIGHSLGEQYLI